MSHRFCSKHSLSPLRYRNQDEQQQSAPQQRPPQPPPNVSQSQGQFISPAKNLFLNATHALSTGISPIPFGVSQAQLPQQRGAFQNFISQDGIALKPQEVDQQKLRLEIEAREHELKLLAQMDYLIDLIKNIDQDRNANIDVAKLQEIQDYKANVEEEINQSFSQNLGRAETPKQGILKDSQKLRESEFQQLEGIQDDRAKQLVSSQKSQKDVSSSQRLRSSLQGSQVAQQSSQVPQVTEDILEKSHHSLQRSQNLRDQAAIEQLNIQIAILQNELNQINGQFIEYKSLYNEDKNRHLIQNYEKLLEQQSLTLLNQNNSDQDQQKVIEDLREEVAQLRAHALAHESVVADQGAKIDKLVDELAAKEDSELLLSKQQEDVHLKLVEQQGNLLNLDAQLQETQSELQKVKTELEEVKQYNALLEGEKEENQLLISDIQNECQKIKNELLGSQNEIQQALLTIEIINKENAELKENQQLNGNQIADLEESNSKLITDLSQATSRNQELSNELDNLQGQLNGANAENQALVKVLSEQQQNESNEEVSVLQSKIEELLTAGEGARNRANLAENLAEEQKHQINYLNDDIQELRQKFIQLEVKKENLVIENNQLKDDQQGLLALREEENQAKEDAQRHVNELQSALEEKHLEIEQVSNDRDQLNRELESLRRSLFEMEQAIATRQVEQKPSENELYESIKRAAEQARQSVQLDPVSGSQNLNASGQLRQIQTSTYSRKSLHSSQQQQLISGSQQLQKSQHSQHSQRAVDVSQPHSHQLTQKEQQLILSQNKELIHSQHELAQSIHSAKISQSLHASQKLKESQIIQDQRQGEHQQQDQENQQEAEGCEDCESCMLEAALIQNEHLKEQLLIKEKEIIELKTNPVYYARVTNYGNSQAVNIPPRSPFNSGKGAAFIEANDQLLFNRIYDSPQIPKFYTSAFTAASPAPLREQVEQQQQQQQQLSGSKVLRGSNASFSASKPQIPQQPQQQQSHLQAQSYTVIQNEIEQLQRIFDSKCKEVEQWKKAYTKMSNYEN